MGVTVTAVGPGFVLDLLQYTRSATSNFVVR